MNCESGFIDFEFEQGVRMTPWFENVGSQTSSKLCDSVSWIYWNFDAVELPVVLNDHKLPRANDMSQTRAAASKGHSNNQKPVLWTFVAALVVGRIHRLNLWLSKRFTTIGFAANFQKYYCCMCKIYLQLIIFVTDQTRLVLFATINGFNVQTTQQMQLML